MALLALTSRSLSRTFGSPQKSTIGTPGAPAATSSAEAPSASPSRPMSSSTTSGASAATWAAASRADPAWATTTWPSRPSSPLIPSSSPGRADASRTRSGAATVGVDTPVEPRTSNDEGRPFHSAGMGAGTESGRTTFMVHLPEGDELLGSMPASCRPTE